MTPIKEMKTADMVIEYNQITGKSIKKFATRADGERMLKAARDAKTLITKLIPTPEQRVIDKKILHTKKVARIRAAENAKNGKVSAKAKVTESKAKQGDKFTAPVVKHAAFKREPTARSVRSAIVELILGGKDNREILEAARKEFGEAKVPSSYPSWYRGQLRRLGVISY